MTLHTQFLTMVSMIVGGIYLGMARDTFRRLSSYWNHRPLLTYFLEISFWVTQTFLLFYVLYRVNAGELRFYIFLACLLGFSMYQVIVATIYQKALERMLTAIATVYRFFKRVIYILVIAPLKWLVYIVLQFLQSIIKLLLVILKFILLPIKWLLQLVYNLLPEKNKNIIRKMLKVYSIIKDTSIKWVKYILFKER